MTKIEVQDLASQPTVFYDEASGLVQFRVVLPSFSVNFELNSYFNVPIKITGLQLDAQVGFNGYRLQVFNPSVNYENV